MLRHTKCCGSRQVFRQSSCKNHQYSCIWHAYVYICTTPSRITNTHIIGSRSRSVSPWNREWNASFTGKQTRARALIHVYTGWIVFWVNRAQEWHALMWLRKMDATFTYAQNIIRLFVRNQWKWRAFVLYCLSLWCCSGRWIVVYYVVYGCRHVGFFLLLAVLWDVCVWCLCTRLNSHMRAVTYSIHEMNTHFPHVLQIQMLHNPTSNTHKHTHRHNTHENDAKIFTHSVCRYDFCVRFRWAMWYGSSCV